MLYTIEQIKERVTPIAEKHNLRAVYLFGSYARGEATENSDIDFLVDPSENTDRRWMYGGLYNDLCEVFGESTDMITVNGLNQKSTQERTPWFFNNVNNEKVKLYG